MLPSECEHRIGRDGNRGRDLRQQPTIRALEPEDAIALSLDPIAVLVDYAVMSPTQQREVWQRGRASVGPVA